jgi:hypothetical protein
MPPVQLRLTSHGRSDLLFLLKGAGIEAEQLHPPPGVIMGAIERWEIFVTATLIASLASVLGRWLRALATRTIIIQIKKGGVFNFQAKGYSEAEATKLLKDVASITAIQTTREEITREPATTTEIRRSTKRRAKRSSTAHMREDAPTSPAASATARRDRPGASKNPRRRSRDP